MHRLYQGRVCNTREIADFEEVLGSQQLASIFCRKLLLAPLNAQNFPLRGLSEEGYALN